MTREFKLAAGALATLGTFPVAFVGRPLILASTIVLCPFKAITGRPCIFCGLTRAFAYATHGDLAEAFHLNPLWIVAATLLIAAGISCIRETVTRTPRDPWWWKLHGTPSWALLAIVVAGSLLRAFVLAA